MDVDQCYISHIQVNRAMRQRRRTYRAHGRVNPYMSSPCHIELMISEKQAGVATEKVRRRAVARVMRLRYRSVQGWEGIACIVCSSSEEREAQSIAGAAEQSVMGRSCVTRSAGSDTRRGTEAGGCGRGRGRAAGRRAVCSGGAIDTRQCPAAPWSAARAWLADSAARGCEQASSNPCQWVWRIGMRWRSLLGLAPRHPCCRWRDSEGPGAAQSGQRARWDGAGGWKFGCNRTEGAGSTAGGRLLADAGGLARPGWEAGFATGGSCQVQQRRVADQRDAIVGASVSSSCSKTCSSCGLFAAGDEGEGRRAGRCEGPLGPACVLVQGWIGADNT